MIVEFPPESDEFPGNDAEIDESAVFCKAPDHGDMQERTLLALGERDYGISFRESGMSFMLLR